MTTKAGSIDLLAIGVQATVAQAAGLADRLRGGEVILLDGDLGSGKTTFVRALVSYLGGADASSPSFTIENIYPTDRWPVHHYDFYRLSALGLEGLALKEVIARADSLVLIEWPDLAKPLLPADYLRLEFQFQADPAARRLVYSAPETLGYLLPGPARRGE